MSIFKKQLIVNVAFRYKRKYTEAYYECTSGSNEIRNIYKTL